MPKTAPRRRARRPGRGRDGAEPAPAAVAGPVQSWVEDPVEDPVEPAVEPSAGPPSTNGMVNGVTREEVVPGPSTGTSVREMTVTVRADDERPVLHRLEVTAWSLVVLAGLAALVAALADVGPTWLDGIGATAVVSAYSWGLAARTGGRPVVFGALTLALGAAVLGLDQDYLRTGAAVMTCVVTAVLAVMVTRPAVRFIAVVRECAIAVLVAAIGAMATIGFAPVVSLTRFEYATLGLALALAFAVVHRLGAGLHGLGRRGIAAVIGGGVLLAVTVLYAEMLRRYGSPELVDHLLDGVRWCRHHVGAFPRPIEAVLGVPALAWGCHMRARRRQGWWLCAFGVAATTPVANALVNPAISLRECGLSVLYGLVVGLLIGYVVIRIDLAFTGSRGQGGRRLEETTAIRPEPPRTAPLL